MTEKENDIKIKLSPYLGCSKKLIEFFAIIGYEEEAIKRSFPNILQNQEQLELSFLSIVISDFSTEIADDYILKQVYPDKPLIIKSGKHPKPDSIIFSSCIDSQTGDSKIFNSCYALRFYEKIIGTKDQETYYIPKAFLIYSQYPYFSTFSRICEKVLNYSDDQDADIEFPIEIFIHCLVNYTPSPININLSLKDFSPKIFIHGLTGYPYADFNLGKVISSVNLIDFIKIYILIFLELDLLFFSPCHEKLNIFMFSLYILNYPLTDSNYFWHIKTISRDDIKDGDDTVSTSFKGVNTEIMQDLDLSGFTALNFVVDIENKKQTIMSISEGKESKEINNLLKYINAVLNRQLIFKKSVFLEECLHKLHKKLKAVLKEYNDLAQNDSNVAESFFYVNSKVIDINRQIQEIFYDFILNILVELNKDYVLDPTLKSPIIKSKVENPKLLEEEKIFLFYSRNTIKYGTYFQNFLTDFKVYDGLKVPLIFSDEYVNLKKQDSYKSIEDKIKYFEIMDKLYNSQIKDLKYDLKDLDSEYSKINYNPNNTFKQGKKASKLFCLDKNIIKKFIYKKKNKALYENIKDPEEIKVEIVNKNTFTFTIQYFLSKNALIGIGYYIRGSAEYILSICLGFFSKDEIPKVLNIFLLNSKKIAYFQRYYIFLVLKSINKYYQQNKEFGTFPEIDFINTQKYYGIILNHLKENSIFQDEEIFKFFNKYYCKKEEDDKDKEIKENKQVFSYIPKLKNYEKVLKIKDNELIYKEKNKVIKFKKLSHNSIPEIYQEMYSYYDLFVTNEFDLKNLDINKLRERIANVILFYQNMKDEQDMINILFYLLNSLLEFQTLLSNTKKSDA